MSRSSALRPISSDADFNPLGANLANNFLQTRNHTFDNKYEVDKGTGSKQAQEKSFASSSTVNHSSERSERDVWAAGGEYLSTNKLSMMLSDMQVQYVIVCFRACAVFI
jgi:aspartokinase